MIKKFHFYYCGQVNKDQRSMDLDTAQAMLTLLLGRQWPLFSQFHQFLEKTKYKVINKDQWCNILEFSRAIRPDLSNYDEDGACKSFTLLYKLRYLLCRLMSD